MSWQAKELQHVTSMTTCTMPDVLLPVQGIREREEDADEGASFASYNSYVEREMGGIINSVKVWKASRGIRALAVPASEQVTPRVCCLDAALRV